MRAAAAPWASSCRPSQCAEACPRFGSSRQGQWQLLRGCSGGGGGRFVHEGLQGLACNLRLQLCLVMLYDQRALMYLMVLAGRRQTLVLWGQLQARSRSLVDHMHMFSASAA